MSDLTSNFRKNIIGNNFDTENPYGRKKMIYADWITSMTTTQMSSIIEVSPIINLPFLPHGSNFNLD